MKKHITLLTAGTMITAMMTGCVIPGGNTVLQACTYDTAPAYAPSHAVTRHTFSDTDTGSGWFSGTYSYDPEEGYFYGESGMDRKSVLTDPSDYEYGTSSPHYEENFTDPDPRTETAALMYDYEGHVYSSDYADLAFTLTGVYGAGGETIDVVFHECQYTLSGIDLGAVYTGTLSTIDCSNYVNMDGYYIYEFPFMDLWEDGSRHPDTFYLKFSFGSNSTEFCVSEIGLLSDTMYMRPADVTAETDTWFADDEDTWFADDAEEWTDYETDSCDSIEDTLNCYSIEDTLSSWAMDYYACTAGMYPSYCECTDQYDGTYALQLYEMVEDCDGTWHTATLAWYWVDADGIGTDILGEPVCIQP